MQENVRRVLQKYDIGDVERLTPLTAGHTAENYLVAVEGDEPFVFRLRPRVFSEDNVEDDHRFLEHLADRGLPVPRPLPRCDGATTGRLAGRQYELIEYLPHDTTLESVGYEDHIMELAGFLGGLHRAAKEYEGVVTAKPAWVGSVPVTLRGKYFAAPLKKGAEHLKNPVNPRLVGELAAQLQRREKPLSGSLRDTPRLVCHNDFYGANILVSAGKIAGLVDFDFCRTTSHLVDLIEGLHGAVLVWTPHTAQHWGLPAGGRLKVKRGREFLEKYQEHSGIEVTRKVVEDFLVVKIVSLALYPGFLPQPLPPETEERLRRVRRAVSFLKDHAGWAL